MLQHDVSARDASRVLGYEPLDEQESMQVVVYRIPTAD